MKILYGVVGLLVFFSSSVRAVETKAGGFILGDQASAFKIAKKENKLLMIDFFGIWCPPCNQLDEHVFSSPDFLKETENFVKLKLDADADVSWELKSKFKVQGYPTVVFATPEGDEVGRIVGYRPLKEFLAEAKRSWESREKSYSRLAEMAKAGDHAAASKLGLMEFERGNYEAAKSAFAQSKAAKYSEKIAISEIRILEEKADGGSIDLEKEIIAALDKSIAIFPSSLDSIDRRISLADKLMTGKPARAKALLKDAIRVANTFIKRPSSLEGMDLTVADLWVEIADANEKLGNKSATTTAWRNAAKEYRKLMKGEERGYSLELAYALWKSGDVPSAEVIYRQFEIKYPEEFTFYHAHANMYYELARYPDARKLQEKAFLFSYGDNKLRAGYNLARILNAEGKKKEAIAIAEKTLAEVKLPADPSIRSHRSAKKLRKMIADLKG